MQVNEIESIRVTTDDVMQAIRDYQQKFAIEHFTTREIAKQMGVDEYPVRTAFSWLHRYQMIETVPCVRSIRYTKAHGEEYSATVYQIKPESTAADFAALNRIFGYGG